MARKSRSRAAVKVLKCAGDVTARDVGGVRVEACLSAHRNRGDAQRLPATCYGQILEEIERIFLFRRNRYRGKWQEQLKTRLRVLEIEPTYLCRMIGLS